MPFLTTKDIILRPFRDARDLNERFKRSNGLNNIVKKVFLFYHPDDKEFIQPIVNILKSLRVNVFVDYLDDSMLENVTNTTTGLLKAGIDASDKVIMITTNGSKEMAAISYEFGLNGSLKNPGKVVIFPVTAASQEWESKERYLDYGFVNKKFDFFNYPEDWLVHLPSGSQISLRNWILG